MPLSSMGLTNIHYNLCLLTAARYIMSMMYWKEIIWSLPIWHITWSLPILNKDVHKSIFNCITCYYVPWYPIKAIHLKYSAPPTSCLALMEIILTCPQTYTLYFYKKIVSILSETNHVSLNKLTELWSWLTLNTKINKLTKLEDTYTV